MTAKQAKFIHHRDNIMTSIRKHAWCHGSQKSPVIRILRGDIKLPEDKELIQNLAAVVASYLSFDDEENDE